MRAMNSAHATVFPFVVALGLVLSGLSGCAAKAPHCDSDADCAATGELCVQGLCRPCADDADCGVNDPCAYCAEGWQCKRVPGCCSSTLDCPSGNVCAAPAFGQPGTCVPGCSGDAQCAPGQVCEYGRCVSWCTCTDDLQCGPATRCVDCRCQATDQGCSSVPVYFDFDEASINGAARAAVDFSAACLLQRGATATLVGHADERGGVAYNDRLAMRRAESVRMALEARGVAKGLVTRSVGKRDPVCTESNEQCWRQNRRVDILQ